MIKAAIFDVDGTLLDSMGIWEDVGARYLREIGIEPEEGLGKILFPMTIEEGAAYVKERYGLSEGIFEIKQGVLAMVKDFYYTEAPLKKGVKEFLKELSDREIPMAVASSGEKECIEAAFSRLGIGKYFKGIFTCGEVGKGKGDPLIYETAGKCLGEKASETYVFEDALYAIWTAKKAGFRTVGVYDRYSQEDTEELRETADVYLKDFSDRFCLFSINV